MNTHKPSPHHSKTNRGKSEAGLATIRYPKWFGDKHAGAWERIKGALQRDWEQTKADLSRDSGHELDQNAVDTIRQATDAETIPPMGVPNLPESGDSKRSDALDINFRDGTPNGVKPPTSAKGVAKSDPAPGDFRGAERALRYGAAAGVEYAESYKEWSDSLEARMKGEWEDLYPDSAWEASRGSIRHAFDAVRRRD